MSEVQLGQDKDETEWVTLRARKRFGFCLKASPRIQFEHGEKKVFSREQADELLAISRDMSLDEVLDEVILSPRTTASENLWDVCG